MVLFSQFDIIVYEKKKAIVSFKFWKKIICRIGLEKGCWSLSISFYPLQFCMTNK